MRTDTKILHLGEDYKALGAVTPPIYQTSLFVHKNCEQFAQTIDHTEHDGERFTYSRVGNPNLNIVEEKIAMLEKAESCKLFASGMAAITAGIMSVVSNGDHVVCVDTAYGPTRHFLTDYLPRFGVQTTMVDGLTTESILDAVQDNTKLIYLESPSSILFRMQDFGAISRFARERDIVTMTDNTYSGAYYQQPIEMGIDFTVHSATKFFGGHSDVCAGAICGSKERMKKIHKDEAQYFGSLMPPFPAWLVMRGMRTLSLRMKHSNELSKKMFEFLRARPEVKNVFHAGDPDHPQAELARKQMTGAVSLMSFEPHVQEQSKLFAFADALQFFQKGVSWGGHESLVVPLPFQAMPWPEPRWVVRLYGGLEDFEDLAEDLDQAFRHLR